MWLVVISVAWGSGIWLASLFSAPLSYWLTGGAINLGMTLLLARRSPTGHLWRVCLILAVIACGGWRYTRAQPQIDNLHIAYYNGQSPVSLIGIVAEEPDVRDSYVNLRVEAESIVLPDGRQTAVSGLVQVQAPRFPVLPYGSRIQAAGSLETPPDDADFSYKEYLARQGVHSLMRRPSIQVIGSDAASPAYAVIFRFKTHLQTVIARLIPDPEAALLTGILLGNDNGLPPDLADAFRLTGMTHIIAISGFNIAILISIMAALSEPLLGPRKAAIFAMGGITFYTILVGADASVIRAALMGGIYLVTSRWLGRPNFAFASLFLAGLLMTLINPFTLWDVGFQLSFAATFSLMLYADPFTQWTRRQLLRFMSRDLVSQVLGVLSEAVILTAAAQILTLPLMMGYFGQLSLISFAANAIILPAQPGVMLWGGFATLAGLAFPFAGQLLAWIAWLFLRYTIIMVRLFAAVPGAAVPINLSPAGQLLIFGTIALLTWFAHQPPATRAHVGTLLRQNLNQRLALSGSVLLFLLAFSWQKGQPDGRLHIRFFDVGQGDATFIQTPSGRQILIDGGLYPSVLNAALGQELPFWDRELDIVIATHPDADHIAGLVGVFERYQVQQLITDGTEKGAAPIFDEILVAAAAQNTQVHVARAGEKIQIADGVALEILHPGQERNSENRNDNSVSMRLLYGRFSFLFSGDAEEWGEANILARAAGLETRPLAALVFKAGHHGSKTSSSLPLLQAIQPQIIIVSAGADNSFGHPHPEMLARAWGLGATVLRTDQLGTIALISDGEGMWWEVLP